MDSAQIFGFRVVRRSRKFSYDDSSRAKRADAYDDPRGPISTMGKMGRDLSSLKFLEIFAYDCSKRVKVTAVQEHFAGPV